MLPRVSGEMAKSYLSYTYLPSIDPIQMVIFINNSLRETPYISRRNVFMTNSPPTTGKWKRGTRFKKSWCWVRGVNLVKPMCSCEACGIRKGSQWNPMCLRFFKGKDP